MQAITIALFLFLWIGELQPQPYSFPWLNDAAAEDRPAIEDIRLPPGYERTTTLSNTFADWLRNLPLKTENNIVYLYNGATKSNQAAQDQLTKCLSLSFESAKNLFLTLSCQQY